MVPISRADLVSGWGFVPMDRRVPDRDAVAMIATPDRQLSHFEPALRAEDRRLRGTLPNTAPRGTRPHRGKFLRAGTVIATSSAIDEIMRLRARCHLVALRHAGEDDARSVCEARMPPRLNDLQLGEIGGVPFLIDADQYRCWGCPDLVVDLSRRDGRSATDDVVGRVRLTLRSSC